jgi:NDP-sugar pyrophosphorylase family protein
LISRVPGLFRKISGDMPPVAILAGGLATRLRPMTEQVPKGLIELAGHPFLYHQLLLLNSRGVRDVVLCVGYLGEMIRREFKDGSALGLHLQYSFDGDTLLGTAGAIGRALPLLGDNFFVLYGDSYLTCDYRAVAEAFLDSTMSGLMTVFQNESRYDASNVEFVEGRILAYDKRNRTPAMRHIDYGLGMFQRRAFANLATGQPCDLADVYRRLLRSGELAAYEVAERFYEIGSLEGIRETEEFLLRRSGGRQ